MLILPTNDGGVDEVVLAAFKRYVINAIDRTEVGLSPFRHLYIKDILPPALYRAQRVRMFQHKYNSTLLDRPQDSELFVNKRFSLVDSTDIETQYFRSIFSDDKVKIAFLTKFFIDPSPSLARSLCIHDEFEYTYTAAGRFQNIHVDIPPKFLSFVFYFPEFAVDTEAEERNATVLYDRQLNPHYKARYRPNSVAVFAPHFYSYHGFASTIEREVLVMFYVSPAEQKIWQAARGVEAAPFDSIRDVIESKLGRYTLIEYGADPRRRRAERDACRINAPRGRIMLHTN